MTSPRNMRAKGVWILICLTLLSVGCNRVKARIVAREGNDFFKGEKYEKAIEKYEEALRLDPTITKVHRNVGLAYLAMFQPASLSQTDKMYADRAIESFKKYLEAHPEDPRAGEYLVTMYLTSSRFDEAIRDLQTLLAKDPNDLKTVQRLALVYQKKGDFDNSYRWRQEQARLVTNEKEKAEAFYTIGVLCWDRSYSYPDLDHAYRMDVVQKGLDALNEATKHRENYFEAVAYINLLYREKAKHDPDPGKKAEYTAEADKYLKMALEMRKKAAASATVIPAPPTSAS